MQRRHVLALALAGAGALAATGAAAATQERGRRFIADMTWIELRAAVAAGATVALVPTGGSEENGPHMAIGKHNAIVRYCADAIAARLGNALIAPVLPYVPEGGFDPPTGNMALPGTLGLSEAAFAAVLRDIARSLSLAGFTAERPEIRRGIDFLVATQKPDGSWLLNPPARDRHAGFDAVFTLKHLGGDSAECRKAIARAAGWALSCRNTDGGFGHFPGSPSDADAVYFQVGTLVMAGYLKPVTPPPPDAELLAWGHLMPVR